MMNGSDNLRQPNGDLSYELVSPMPSNTRSQYEGNLSTGVGQISMTDVTLEQALERIQELHKENNDLRDYLKENNEVMKNQYQNLALWKEKIRENNARNKEKFDHTREVVQSLTKENAELKSDVNAKTRQIADLQKDMEMLKNENQAKNESVCELNKRIDDLKKDLERKPSRASDCVDTVLVHADKSEMDTLQKENEKLTAKISELDAQICQFRESNENLLKDLQSYGAIKQDLQTENVNLEKQNAELTHKIQELLRENKTVKTDNKSYMSKIEELENRISQAACLGLEARKEEDRKVTTADSNTNKVSDLQQQLQQRNEEMMFYRQQQEQHISTLTKQHEQQKQELLQQFDRLQHELQQTKDEQTISHTTDMQSLRSQVLSLISQVKETQNKLKAAEDMLEKKNIKVQELEHRLNIGHDEIQRQRSEDGSLIETLRLSLKSYEDALMAERKEHANTKKNAADIRQSFNQMVSDHKNLSEKYDRLKMQEHSRQQQGLSESEKKKLLDQIGRLTAQVLAAEEAITYRDEKLKRIQEENKKIKEELDNVVPVLKAQAEVWKSDFDAERNAREQLHAEKGQLEQEFKQLQVRNQQLMDDMENYSKRQFQEMQQRHSNQPYQQNIQQHLRVGQQNHANPYSYNYPTPTYQTQQGAMYTEPKGPPVTPTQSHSGSQQEDEMQQFECPKCGQTCPDMDTLQIHVLECIDQDQDNSAMV